MRSKAEQKLNAHFMCYPQISCSHSAGSGSQSFTFYILSKGNNAGQPKLLPWVNSFAVHCLSKEDLDFYFWLCYSLWQAGHFRQYLRGSVIPFLSVCDARYLVHQSAKSIQPHWQHLQGVIATLNKLKTAKAHLAQCIISNEKLQQMLLRIHF